MNGWDDDSTGVRGGWPVAAALGLLAGVCGLAALASIILLHGLGTIPWPEGNLFFRIYRWRFMVTPSEALLGVEVGAAILLAVERLLRLALARSRRRFLRRTLDRFGDDGRRRLHVQPRLTVCRRRFG